MKSGRILAGFALLAIAITLISERPVAAQTVTVQPTAVWTPPQNNPTAYGANRASFLFDPTLSGGSNAVFFNDYIGAEDTILTYANNTQVQFDAYCIDLKLPLLHTPYQADLLSTNLLNLGAPGVPDNVRGGGIAWLYNNYVGAAYNSNIKSAALQLAIWEAEYDWNGTQFATFTAGNVDLDPNTGGNFRYGASQSDTAAVRIEAQNMLTQWGGKQDEATWIRPVPNNNGQLTSQSLVGPSSSRGVPEPGVLGFLLVGAPVALGMSFRRRYSG